MVQYAILYSVDWVWKLIYETEFKSSNNIGQIIIFYSTKLELWKNIIQVETSLIMI